MHSITLSFPTISELVAAVAKLSSAAPAPMTMDAAAPTAGKPKA